MPSSTSSFKWFGPSTRAPDKSWLLIWILVAVLTVAAIASAELFWRSRGHRPSVVDNPALWAYHRGQVDQAGNKTVVLLGASRINSGFSTETFRQKLPDYHVVQLAIAGKFPIAALRDLAQDEQFNGVVICSVVARGMRKERWEDQQKYVDTYHRQVSYNDTINTLLRRFFQKRLVVVNPRVGFKPVLKRVLAGRSLPPTSPMVTNPDRSRANDFSMVKNIEKYRQGVIDRLRERYAKMSLPSPEQWLTEAKQLEPMIKKIEDRGGRVVFVHYPVDEEYLALDEQHLSREKYWDRFAAATDALTIFFQDEPTLSGFDCPDASHLDAADIPRFTTALIDVLIARGVIQP